MSAILPSSTLCCPTAFCDEPITVSVPGPPGPQGEQGPVATGELAGWFTRANLALARLIPASDDNVFLVMLGGAVPLDGFGGQLAWAPLNSDLDDYTVFGGTTINPTGNPGLGRWKRYL